MNPNDVLSIPNMPLSNYLSGMGVSPLPAEASDYGTTYGTPAVAPMTPMAKLSNYFNKFNTAMLDPNVVKAMAMGGDLMGTLFGTADRGVGADMFRKKVGQMLAGSLLGNGSQVPVPQKTAAPLVPVANTTPAPTPTPIPAQQVTPTTINPSSLGNIISGSNTPPVNFSGAPVAMPTPSIGQDLSSPITTGAFPTSGLSPLDTAMISALTYEPRGREEGGYGTALGTLKESAAARTNASIANTQALEAATKLKEYDLKRALQPYAIDLSKSQTVENEAKAKDLQAKNTQTGSYDPKSIAQLEGAKKLAEARATTQAKIENIANTPMANELIAPDIVAHFPALKGKTYGALAQAGMDVKDLIGELTKKQNAILSASVSKDQNSALIAAIQVPIMQAADRAIANYDRIGFDSTGMSKVDIDKTMGLTSKRPFTAAQLEDYKSLLTQKATAIAQLDAVTGKKSGKAPPSAQQRLDKGRGKEAAADTQGISLPPGATNVEINGDIVTFKVNGEPYKAKKSK